MTAVPCRLALALLPATSLPAQTTGALPNDLAAFVLRTLQELVPSSVPTALVTERTAAVATGAGGRRHG